MEVKDVIDYQRYSNRTALLAIDVSCQQINLYCTNNVARLCNQHAPG